MRRLGPRLVIAGTHSGVGKTTVATGLMAALRSSGLQVASAKVGPDFIDPGYHRVATGRPARNLDAWMGGAESLGPLAGRASAGADVLVIEGVMGLFDGSVDSVAEGVLATGSTAELGVLLNAPIILVVDGASMSASVGALVHGYQSFHPRVQVSGVILNRVGSDIHEQLLREALAGLSIPIVGVIRRHDDLTWRDRHLGLIPVAEQPQLVADSIRRLGQVIASSCDLQQIMTIARSAPSQGVEDVALPSPSGRARIAVAGGAAFSFTYPDNLEALTAAGAEIVPFDPLRDSDLPDATDGVIIGGGFPEVYAGGLAANTRLLSAVRERLRTGLVVWAECGGLLWLSTGLTDLDGHRHEMVGAVAGEGVMTRRLTLGYRTATTQQSNPLGEAGLVLRGHEFHYSVVGPSGEALALRSRFTDRLDGFATPNLLATYLHVHLGAAPGLAETFVRRVSQGQRG